MKNQNRFRSDSHIGILDDYRFRIVLLSLLILIAFTMLILRAYYLQLHHGEEHRERIEKQSIRRIRLPGWRGSIYSSDGELLAGNRTVYDLVFYPEGMRTGGGIKRTIETRIKRMATESLSQKLEQNAKGMNLVTVNGVLYIRAEKLNVFGKETGEALWYEMGDVGGSRKNTIVEILAMLATP